MADRIHYGGEWKWAKKVTDLLNEGGGGGNVDDVKVNGTSVVDANKVAQIDLTPYAKTADLATVATSGDYDDLQNKPTIPAAQVQSDWLEADTSAKSYIQNKPTIPSAQVQSDWNEADSSAVDYIKNKPTIPPTLTASGNIEIDSNVIRRKEVWLTMAEYTALQNPDANTDYHITDGTYPVADQLPITVVNGKLCYHFRREVT